MKQSENEYLSVKEICLKYNQCARHVRRKAEKLSNEHSKDLIYKAKNNKWYIHQLLVLKFKPQRNRIDKYYAMTIDPVTSYTEANIHEIMSFVVNQITVKEVEINYAIEAKIATGVNHIHCYVKCSNRRQFMNALKLGFSSLQFHTTEIFDLNGWISYITKTGNKITKIKK